MTKETYPVSGYETTFITRAEMTDEQLKTLQERLNAVVAEYRGDLVLHEDWGSKRLAYKIEKESRGRYTHMVYTGAGNIVAEIERNLRMNDHVMRFLSVNVAKEFDKDAYFKFKETMKAQAKQREEEREARRQAREAKRAMMDEGYDDDEM